VVLVVVVLRAAQLREMELLILAVAAALVETNPILVVLLPVVVEVVSSF